MTDAELVALARQPRDSAHGAGGRDGVRDRRRALVEPPPIAVEDMAIPELDMRETEHD